MRRVVQLEVGSRRRVVLAIAIALWGAGCPASGGEDHRRQLAEVFLIAAIPIRAQPIAGYVDDALVRHHQNLADPELEIARSVARRQYAAAAIASRALERLQQEPPTGQLDAALAWLHSELGQRIAVATFRSLAPAAMEEVQTFISYKESSPPSQRRIDLVERYNVATGAAELAAKTVLYSTLGAGVVIDARPENTDPLGAEALRTLVEGQLELVHPVFAATVQITTSMMFQDFSEDEIESCVGFAESDAGRWFYRVAAEALLGTLLETSMQIGDAYRAALAPPTGS